jgi:hypothetical protein
MILFTQTIINIILRVLIYFKMEKKRKEFKNIIYQLTKIALFVSLRKTILKKTILIHLQMTKMQIKE